MVAGSTVSAGGPAVTISGNALSLGLQGLVVNGTSTVSIPTVQPLQSVFPVGGKSITELYGRIVFPSGKPVANISVAAVTGTAAAAPVPTASTTQPFLGAAVKWRSDAVLVVWRVIGAFVVIVLQV